MGSHQEFWDLAEIRPKYKQYIRIGDMGEISSTKIINVLVYIDEK